MKILIVIPVLTAAVALAAAIGIVGRRSRVAPSSQPGPLAGDPPTRTTPGAPQAPK